jgi:hypothetical protein
VNRGPPGRCATNGGNPARISHRLKIGLGERATRAIRSERQAQMHSGDDGARRRGCNGLFPNRSATARVRSQADDVLLRNRVCAAPSRAK